MAILCLDVGNTHAHWGLVAGRSILASGELPTASLSTEGLRALLTAQAPTGLALASVVPSATATIEPVLLGSGLPYHHLRHDTVRGLGFDYPRPAEVGQDRLADCVGAQLVAGAPAVVVGMGTATTVDILTEQGPLSP